MRRTALAALAILGLCGNAPANEGLLEKWRWRVFTPQNGLPERDFAAIFQARNGLYYAASGSRIFRYDGYRWDELPFAGQSGPEDPIRVITESRDGAILAATARGIWAARLGASFQRVLSAEGLCLAAGEERQIYFMASGSLHRLEGARVHRLQAVEAVPADGITCMAVDGDQVIWVGTDQGLLRQEGYSWRPDPELAALGLDGATCCGLFVTSGLKLWASLRRPDGGWALLERRNGRWQAPAPGAPAAAVLALTGYPDGVVYAATTEGGLYRCDFDGRWSRFPSIWPGSAVTAASIVDDRGALWLCLSAVGIARFDARGDRWQPLSADALGSDNERVLSLLVARDGATWVGAEQRLSRITGAGAETFTMTPSHPLRRVSALAEDASGAIWTGSPEAFPGAWVLDGGRWSHFRLPPPYEGVTLHRIIADRERRLWFIAAERHRAGAWAGDGKSLTHFDRDAGLASDVVYAVHVSAGGAVWFGTDRGLSRISNFTDRMFRHFTREDGLAADRVWDVGEGNDGTIWAAHQIGGGVSRFNERAGKWTRYGIYDGMANESVWSIAGSPLNDVWFGTQGGITRFDGATFYNYEIAENPLISNVWPLAIAPRERGVLAGTLAGGAFRFRREDNDPPAVFPAENIRVFPHGQPIRLSWDARDRFDQTHREDLLYTLTLLTNNRLAWTRMHREQTFVADSLPPGHHTLLVHAHDLDGNQAPVPVRIEFLVALPWYRRIAVLGGVGLGAAFLVAVHAAAFKWRARARRAQALLRRLAAETNLTLVAAGARGRINAVEGAAPPGLRPGLRLRDSACGRKLALMAPGSGGVLNLDDRRWRVEAFIAEGVRGWSLSPERGERPPPPPPELAAQAETFAAAARAPARKAAFVLAEVLAELLRGLPPEAARRVTAAIPVPAALWRVVADRDDVREILSALIANAVESAENARVFIAARNRRFPSETETGTFVEIEVLDEGPGIAGDLWQPFTAFHTAKPGHRGLGLTIALGLARRNEARLALANRPEHGLRAWVCFPARRG